MDDRPFFDTTVLIYAVSQGDYRASVAEGLLAAGGFLSVQVLNEFVSVARRKLKKPWDEVQEALELLRSLCEPAVPLTIATHERAVQLAVRFRYNFYDALILAAALEAGCNVLYSEDMQDGQTMEGLTIRNPFKARHG